jgi:hypothetical protein
MMGNKTVAQIRGELEQELARSGLEPAEWYDRQLQKLKSKSQLDRADLESLRLIRDALESLRNPEEARAK